MAAPLAGAGAAGVLAAAGVVPGVSGAVEPPVAPTVGRPNTPLGMTAWTPQLPSTT